jgi:hypothetical protein
MAKSNRIPKKVAGMKVPKMVRKSPVLQALLASEAGRQVLGQALMAGAAAAAGVLAGTKSDTVADASEKVVRGTKKGGSVARDALQSATGAMANVITDAARAVLPDTDKDRRAGHSRH